MAGFRMKIATKEKHLREILEAFSENFEVTLTSDVVKGVRRGERPAGILF